MSRFVSLASIAIVSTPAAADLCTDITDDNERLVCFDTAYACVSLQSSVDRLECFDNAYSQPDSLNVLVDDEDMTPDAVTASIAPVAAELATSPEEFAERNSATSGGEITAKIVEVTTNAFKIDFIHLDNGHVWRENENSRVRFEVGQKVKIEEGILGSFNLTVEGSSKTVKVNRVK